MDWTVLGIEPTTDAYKIEQAYNERLQNIDLENRPEEFTKLRAAYEEALKLSGDKAGSQADFRPGFLSLYADLSRRIDPAHWKFFLDEQDKALGWNKSMRSLLDELMDRHILPAKVWRYLEDRYHFSEQKEILYGNYPRSRQNGKAPITSITECCFIMNVDTEIMNVMKNRSSLPAFEEKYFVLPRAIMDPTAHIT